MKGLRLYKSEKLCSRTAVERLFAEGTGLMAYPLRAMMRLRPRDEQHPAQMLITIPKKRIRHAVDRVLLRRRLREAYRLHRLDLLYPALQKANVSVDIAFVYVANDVSDYALIERKMMQLLTRLAEAANRTGKIDQGPTVESKIPKKH